MNNLQRNPFANDITIEQLSSNKIMLINIAAV